MPERSVIIGGKEKLTKNFLCVFYNPSKDEYTVLYNELVRSPCYQRFEISDDYDFGPIDPIDLAIEMFNDKKLSYPGLTRT